jgi:glycosyltransferase involved in cell wall biosynthesis
VALMEAMACELPVVASDISGIPELVEHGRTGLLVPPRAAAAIADALERLAADPALRVRMGRHGRAKVLREFDLHTNARTLLQLFACLHTNDEAGARADAEQRRSFTDSNEHQRTALRAG